MLMFDAICAAVFSLILVPLGSASDLQSDTAVLLALRSAVRGRPLLWDLTQPTPCNWVGVQCRLGRVTGLHLPAMGLSGVLPSAGAIGNLTRLTTLSLRFNRISGRLPSDIASCADLRNINLQGNTFSGGIPAGVFSLPNLVRFNLAGNRLSGAISPGFGNLTRLEILFLENNQLTGSIPDLKLRNLLRFNVSWNRLNGPVPPSLSAMPASSFSGNSLCGSPLAACAGQTMPVIADTGRKLSGGAIAGIVIGSVLGFLALVVVLVLLFKGKKGDEREVSADTGPGKREDAEVSGEKQPSSLSFFGNAPNVFDLDALLRASAEVLGKGTFGTSYKVTLEMGFDVAVKRLKGVTMGERELREKMEAIGGMDHQNLVPLRAYCAEEKLVVYDYMPTGSLSALLHGDPVGGGTPLDWETRAGIALGAARAIAYLHSIAPILTHGNIKSSNILLTISFKARVSDFGLAQIVALPAATHATGYRAPELSAPQKVSQKTDVYSFGVLLLELLTGRAPADEEGFDLPRWVRSVVREEWISEVFDVELVRDRDVDEEMVELLQVAVDCTAWHPKSRPHMADMVRRIEEICRSTSRKMGGDSQDDLADDLSDD